jgi:hypothetical protein
MSMSFKGALHVEDKIQERGKGKDLFRVQELIFLVPGINFECHECGFSGLSGSRFPIRVEKDSNNSKREWLLMVKFKINYAQ